MIFIGKNCILFDNNIFIGFEFHCGSLPAGKELTGEGYAVWISFV
jgi:hypothetical protein